MMCPNLPGCVNTAIIFDGVHCLCEYKCGGSTIYRACL